MGMEIKLKRALEAIDCSVRKIGIDVEAESNIDYLQAILVEGTEGAEGEGPITLPGAVMIAVALQSFPRGARALGLFLGGLEEAVREGDFTNTKLQAFLASIGQLVNL